MRNLPIDGNRDVQRLLACILRTCTERKITVSTAESCTGGLIAKYLTDLPGSSAFFVGSAVTYTNELKIQLLGVDPDLIARETEVSIACAKAMAEGVCRLTGSTIALSTTGYAGPGGGTEKNPVGTVYIAIRTPEGAVAERYSAPEGADRQTVREGAALRALSLLETHL